MNNDKPVNLCKNCEHSRRHILLGWSYATCNAPKNMIPDLVSGSNTIWLGYQHAENQRIFSTGCSPEGRWFEKTNKSALLKFLGA